MTSAETGFIVTSARDADCVFGWGQTREEALGMAKNQWGGAGRYVPRYTVREMDAASYTSAVQAAEARRSAWLAA